MSSFANLSSFIAFVSRDSEVIQNLNIQWFYVGFMQVKRAKRAEEKENQSSTSNTSLRCSSRISSTQQH